MALSNQRVVSDGTLVTLDVSFDFFDHSEIGVYFDSVPQTEGPAPTGTWEWGSTANIVFDPAVPNGVEVMLQRKTDASELRHEFTKGSEFKADTLDENFRQVLHIVQEATESNFSKDFFDDINMNGFQIYNLGPATQDNHAISLGDVKQQSATAWQAAAQADVSKTAAAALAATANAAAGAANTSANTADGHRQAAAASAATASGAATTATQQAQGASASAYAANQSAIDAYAYAATASNWAAKMDGPVSGGEYSAKYWAQQSVNLALPDGYITQPKLATALSTKVDNGQAAFDRKWRGVCVDVPAGTDPITITESGAYNVNTDKGPLSPTSTWYYLEVLRHSNTALMYMHQRMTAMDGAGQLNGVVWERVVIGGVAQPWRSVMYSAVWQTQYTVYDMVAPNGTTSSQWLSVHRDGTVKQGGTFVIGAGGPIGPRINFRQPVTFVKALSCFAIGARAGQAEANSTINALDNAGFVYHSGYVNSYTYVWDMEGYLAP